jgi:hypothetical protein
MILYLKQPKDSTKKLLDLTNNFGNVEGYKVNIKKSAAFLYTNNEKAEKESRQISLTIMIKYQK